MDTRFFCLCTRKIHMITLDFPSTKAGRYIGTQICLCGCKINPFICFKYSCLCLLLARKLLGDICFGIMFFCYTISVWRSIPGDTWQDLRTWGLMVISAYITIATHRVTIMPVHRPTNLVRSPKPEHRGIMGNAEILGVYQANLWAAKPVFPVKAMCPGHWFKRTTQTAVHLVQQCSSCLLCICVGFGSAV